MMKPLSIYVHIPFCIKKCRYCDFLSAPAAAGERKAYLEALLAEIEQESAAYGDYQVQTVFIGGGTPSLLSVGEIDGILCKLKSRFHFAVIAETEITIEANPGSVTAEKLRGYRQAGINRLSIGLQSADDTELKLLGRIHTWRDFLQTYDEARNVGFTNINVDLMAALPGQSLRSYQDSLEKVTVLGPEHISAYGLIIEPDTPFYDLYAPGREEVSLLPDEELEREMYEQTAVLLAEKNYARYEISNYARPGFQCRHNMVYWMRGDYVGFGLGAASLIANTRWNNVKNIDSYINGLNSPGQLIRENCQILSNREQMEEFMFLGLRLTEGVSQAEFYRYFRQDIKEIYGSVLAKLEADQLIAIAETIRLTPYGTDISNYVMAQFIFGDNEPNEGPSG